ncbi:MAG: gamma-glutamyltransferase [Burkholderiaceae bacterium]|nr:gamma-glutamyltransferase [Burkholderiaceae bacterium]
MTPSNSAPWRRTRLSLALVLACSVFAVAQAREGEQALGIESSVKLPPQAKGKPPVWAGPAFRQGVVSVANPYAQAGARILEQGGNAIDAAVAIVYALNVVEPQSAGIGGGGSMLVHLAQGGQWADLPRSTPASAPRPAPPRACSRARSASMQASTSGHFSRPRAGHGARHGGGSGAAGASCRLAQNVAQARHRSSPTNGFAATPRYVVVAEVRERHHARKVYPKTAEDLCPGGATARVAVGELVKNEPLAETLRTIAQRGPDAFYSGEIAKGVIEGQKRFRSGVTGAEGGRMTLQDLADYAPALRTPVAGTYRGYTIKAMGSPSSGGLAVLQMLGLLERFPLGDATQGFGFGTTRTLNVMAEAMRIAFADRAVWMGDDDFVDVPEKGLIDRNYTAIRSQLINPDARQATNPVAGDPRQYEMVDADIKRDRQLALAEVFSGPGGSTTHFTVVDKSGNMVSYTNTIESSHGAGMFAGYYPDGCAEISCFRNFGFLLNNELTDFNFTPAASASPFNPGANDVAPNKRPRSSMVPAMIFDRHGEPLVAYGSPGGATIINSVFNVTLNLIDHRMTLQDAIDAPRLSVTAAGGAVNIDSGAPGSKFNTPGSAVVGFPQTSLDGLRALGHTVNAPVDIGSVQAVAVEPKTGKQYGAADARREGTVIGLPRSRGR